MKRIFLHLHEYGASGLYRAILPARFCTEPLAKEGIELVLSGELKSWDKYDAYMFHRVFNPKFVPTLGLLARDGRTIVLETDDDLWNVPSWNPVSYKEDELGILSLTAEMSDILVVSTGPLAEATGHPEKCIVAPNLVDLDTWPKPKQRKNVPIRILWAGSPTHSRDLELLIDPIGSLLDTYGERIEFYFWGYCHPEIIKRYYLKGIRFVNPSPLPEYISTLMAIAPDIALCPLVDEKFNHSKSNIKWLEMSMGGAAVVASPVGPYRCINAGQDGLVASTPGSWHDAISDLIDHPALRQQINQEARSRIADEFSWQGLGGPQAWLQMFRTILGTVSQPLAPVGSAV